jgi:hypothetical protein
MVQFGSRIRLQVIIHRLARRAGKWDAWRHQWWVAPLRD